MKLCKRLLQMALCVAVVDIVAALKEYGTNVSIFVPWASPDEVKHEYGLDITTNIDVLPDLFDAVVLAVAHNEFKEINLHSLIKEGGALYDVKGVKGLVDGKL